jgi:hypothetical protein
MAPVRVVHAWVGARPPAEPTVVGAPAIAPDELPSCDVLELDCEGAELDILERMTIQPRALVVEAHGVFGAPTETVRRVIESRGYQVLWVRLAEERLHDLHEAQDVRVLVALR